MCFMLKPVVNVTNGERLKGDSKQKMIWLFLHLSKLRGSKTCVCFDAIEGRETTVAVDDQLEKNKRITGWPCY